MKPDRRLMSRREFLIAAGCGCAATVLVGSGCARNSAAAADTVVCPYGYVYDTWPGQCPRYVDSNSSGYCDYSDPIAATMATALQTTDSALTTATDTTVAAPSAAATVPAATVPAATVPAATVPAATVPAATAMATTAASTTTTVAPTATAVAPTTTAVALVALCNRGCRAPGRCGRFTDNNDTGICDLSEGIPADQAAQYAQPSGRGG